MSVPLLTPTLVIILFIILAIINTFSRSNFSQDFRKKQAQEAGSEAKSVMNKIERMTAEKVKFSKREDLETICRQAGISLKYHQFLVLKILFGIGTAALSYLLLRNEFLSIELLFVGQMIPKQIITIIRNQRVEKLEKQIGPFMQMVIQRYLGSKDFEKALRLTRDEFKGMEPIYGELSKTIADIESKVPVSEALDLLAERCLNSYLERLADYYKIVSEIGTQEARTKLLNQAYYQYKENRELKDILGRELSEPVRDSYMMIGVIPLFMMFGIFALDGYVEFITGQLIGKLMVAGVFGVCMGLIWFINNKIAAPLR